MSSKIMGQSRSDEQCEIKCQALSRYLIASRLYPRVGLAARNLSLDFVVRLLANLIYSIDRSV